MATDPYQIQLLPNDDEITRDIVIQRWLSALYTLVQAGGGGGGGGVWGSITGTLSNQTDLNAALILAGQHSVISVVQANSFSLWNCVYDNNGTWTLSDNVSAPFVGGVISAVTGAGFNVTMGGYENTITGLAANTQYYLGSTGLLTATAPTGVTSFVVPVLRTGVAGDGIVEIGAAASNALIPVASGGTGIATLIGIPYGTGTAALSTVTIGTGLTFSGGTLTATGGSGATLGANTFTDTQTITQATANHSILLSTGYSVTGASSNNGIDLAGTFNTSGTPTALKVNIVDTAAGAGSLLMDLQVGGTTQFNVNMTGDVTPAGNWVLANGFQIKSISGNVKLHGGAGSVEIADNALFFSVAGAAKAVIQSTVDGVVELTNSAQTSFTALQLGGTTASFPSLRISGTTLQARLADNSADAPFTAAAGTFSGILTATSAATSLANTTIAGAAATTALTLTQTARTSGVLPYIKWTIPTDTSLTASTEAPGLLTVTGTRQWATGALTTQRENLFVGPTIAFVGASTLTDGFTVGITPVVQGTNATITRIHSLGILDPTSAASAVTGGLIVATTFGTAATSVGIGGGNVNAGGTIISGGAMTVGTTLTATGGASSLANTTIAGAAATTALTLTQTARTSGSLPYIKWTIPTDTAQATTAESPGLQVLTGTRQWTAGTVALQRENLFAAPTYAQTSAGTFTEAATFTVSGAPISGTNSSITTTDAVLIQAGAVNGAGTAPVTANALKILNPTGASGKNFALQAGTSGTGITNIRHGITSALVAGTSTVTDAGSTANTRYFFTPHALGTITIPASYYASARSAGTNFTITSSQVTDTSTVDWMAIEP